MQHIDAIHLDCEGTVNFCNLLPDQDVFFYVIFQLFGNILITIISGGLPIIMMDHEKIKEGVRLMLEGIGEDIHREGLLDTPDRIARMCEQIYGGLYENAATHLSKQFHATNNNIVLEKDITFYSTCEHHLLPFYGKAHVAYIPDQRVAGLSKLARTVEVFARRPQIQENLTAQIADALEEYLQPKGVMVMIEAEHMCMTMRGVQKPGSKTVTTIVRGAFAEDFTLQQTFLQMVKG